MSVKLVIWGFDGVLNEARADLIRRLNKRGIVSAICARGDAAQAAARFKTLKLTDQTVFNRIPSGPTGPAIKALLTDIGIAAEDALFITTASRERDEARFYNPGLQLADAAAPDCDAAIEALIAESKPQRKSKRAEYARLEKQRTSTPATGGNEAFLKSCEIKVAVARRGDCFDFAPQIAALLGDTDAAAIRDGLTGYYRDFDARALFAWDKYRQFGLVGFAAVKDGAVLSHFAVSPAVSGLGIEGWFLDMLGKPDQFPKLDLAGRAAPAKADWITWEPFKGGLRHEIITRETGRDPTAAALRIIAGHQSAPLAHFTGLGDRAETDMQPHGFELRHISAHGTIFGHIPNRVVYFAACDYDDAHAPWGGWKDGFDKAAGKFCEILTARRACLLLVLPPQTLGGFRPDWNLGRDRITAYNNLWRRHAANHPMISLLELDEIGTADELIDVRHYKPAMLRRIGETIANWFAAAPRLKAAE